jgi:hypothetical protein
MNDSSEHKGIFHAQTALLVAIALTLTLPESLAPGPRYLIAGLELLLIFGIVIVAPLKHSLGARIRRNFAVILIGLISLVNIATMILIVDNLINGATIDGKHIIFSAFAIYVTNIIIFSIWYWEIDRPGLSGVHWRDASPNFLFNQELDGSPAANKWKPSYVDYLYISLSNSTANTPSDAVPITHEAKTLMGIQAVVALMTVVLVTARAVSTLG